VRDRVAGDGDGGGGVIAPMPVGSASTSVDEPGRNGACPCGTALSFPTTVSDRDEAEAGVVVVSACAAMANRHEDAAGVVVVAVLAVVSCSASICDI